MAIAGPATERAHEQPAARVPCLENGDHLSRAEFERRYAAMLMEQQAAFVEVHVAETVGLTATIRLRADLALHVLRLDPAFHAIHTPGELIERTDGDVATLGNFFSRFVVYLCGNALLLVGILVLLAQID